MVAFTRFLLSIVFTVFYRVEIIGKEKLPSEGPVVLCSNHIGQMDMFFIGYRLKRLVHYMAKHELFKIPVIGFIIKNLGAFPVRRGTGDVKAIKTSLNLLKNGNIVGIYPEGTRVKEGTTVDIKPGAAMLVQKTGALVMPVAIKGKYRIFSKVKVVFGEPFSLNMDSGKKYSNSELVEKTEYIMERVYSLLEG